MLKIKLGRRFFLSFAYARTVFVECMYGKGLLQVSSEEPRRFVANSGAIMFCPPQALLQSLSERSAPGDDEIDKQ